MALPGMKSTSDFATDERPKNFREGILRLTPRNNTPLFALTAAMRSESTDDPEFAWWEEPLQMYAFTVSADVNNSTTTIPLTSGGLMLKPGDTLRVDASGEVLRVASIVSDTSITVQTRGSVGPGGTPAGTAASITAATNAKLLYIGSAYREGAPRSIGHSINPTKKRNYTQIFRTPVEWTRTAMQTRLRTGNAQKEDRFRTLNKHAMGIERAMFLGTAYETLENGQPLRFTGGLLNFIPSSNVATVTSAGVDLDELESYFASIFAYGSGEKVAWGSIKTLTIIQQILRKNGQITFGPSSEKEYGMNVRRIYTPAGTLTFMEHPLFGQAGQFLAEDLLIMDTARLRYRYLTGADTQLLKDREDRGQDGKAEEYLTECGLEVQNPETFYLLKGFKKAAKDD